MGRDPLGDFQRHWDNTEDAMEKAKERIHAAFEFMEKLQIEYFCFHDADIAPRDPDNLAGPTEGWMKSLKLSRK